MIIGIVIIIAIMGVAFGIFATQLDQDGNSYD